MLRNPRSKCCLPLRLIFQEKSVFFFSARFFQFAFFRRVLPRGIPAERYSSLSGIMFACAYFLLFNCVLPVFFGRPKTCFFAQCCFLRSHRVLPAGSLTAHCVLCVHFSLFVAFHVGVPSGIANAPNNYKKCVFCSEWRCLVVFCCKHILFYTVL